jgi:DNA-binding PadR family transcriptional regulator
MALSHAILAIVLNGPMTGYDLAKRFSKRSGYIWRATHQQIYRELAKLEQNGFLEPVEEGSDIRSDRVPRSITRSGREHLLEWVVLSNEPASIKDEILVKCMTLGLASAEQVARAIADRRAQQEERLAFYRSTIDGKYQDPRSLEGEALGSYLALSGGIRYETAWIAWADEALDLLRALRLRTC